MVKKWVVILSIIGILVAGCIFESVYLDRSFKSLRNELENFQAVIEKTEESLIDSEDNILFMKSLHEEWHEKLRVLKSLIWHTGLKEIEVSLSRIQAYVENQEKTETLAELCALTHYLEHYADDFLVSIENIM
ncbi:MAG: DUF4363 family protein [Clostridia bacterium]|nr:DUF4363 family protein [Clostridia bacterium]